MEETGKKRPIGFGSMSIKTKKPKVIGFQSSMLGDTGRLDEEKKRRSKTDPLVIPLIKDQTEEERIAAQLAAEARGISFSEESIESQRVIVNIEKKKPLLAAAKLPGLENIIDDNERLRRDVSLRANDCDRETYDHVPVEEYGAALLRGMGWTGNTVSEAFVPKIRHHRLGLGAEPKPEEIFDKKGAPRQGASTNQAIPKKVLSAGDICTGIAGFVGADAIIDQTVKICEPVDALRPNHAIVEFRGKRISVPARALRYTPDAPFMDLSQQNWLCTGIRVRVTQRSHSLFRKKAQVLKVFRPQGSDSFTAQLLFDDGTNLELRQKYLETALPKKDDTRVTILIGPHKGRQALLLRRDKSKEIAFVKLLSARSSSIDTLEEIPLSFDYIAETVLTGGT
mmetsp:Transcript_12385/g.15545  ORF Transcript_12385/g.15545 Transcript_12385/m.15545 type:complete len:396 (-) Transcript_12385:92-1279(-)